MSVSRRSFVTGLAAAPALGALPGTAIAAPKGIAPDRFDPWIEVDAAALKHNVETISRLSGGRPILAVIKNNAYGLGLTTVASILEPLSQVKGFAVVKAAEAIALRESGISKPILLLSLFSDRDGVDLARLGIQFSICTDDAAARVIKASKSAGSRAEAHYYLDTGMSRMGIPYHRALPVLQQASELDIDIKGTFMGFTEETEFDSEQLRRFTEFAATASDGGIALGSLHAASSHAVFNFPESHLDQVRPGIALFGAYPSDAAAESRIATLMPAVRLRARIVRVEHLRTGDSVSYGGHYVASEPTWIATIPAGHTDGIPRSAVAGSHAVVNGTAYPIIGAVSASHTIIELGSEPSVSIGDVATLLGSEDEAIYPNRLAANSDTSVYDILMHLNPNLPKTVI